MVMNNRIGAMMARNNRPDTAADIAWRRRHNSACEQANRETRERYPNLTADNVDEALAFQSGRIAALMVEAS